MRRGCLTGCMIILMLGYLAPTHRAAAFAWGNFAGDEKLSGEARANAAEYLAALAQIYAALSKLEIDPQLNMSEQFYSAQKRFGDVQGRLLEFSVRVSKAGDSLDQRLDLKRLSRDEAIDYARSHEALGMEFSSSTGVAISELFGGADHRRVPMKVSTGLASMARGTQLCRRLMASLIEKTTPMTTSDVDRFLSALNWLTQMGLLFSKVAPQ